MWQRIQSVYLLLVVVFLVLFMLLPLGVLQITGTSVQVIVSKGNALPGEMHLSQSEWLRTVLSLLPAMGLVFTVYTISQFRRRLFQIKLGKLNLLIHLLILVVSFFYLDQLKEAAAASLSYGPAVFLPLVSLILILMANKAIGKDEKLVRAADRIR